MSDWFDLIAAVVLLLLGLRLSAFFSGAETGFYRVSLVRLSIEAHAGNAVSARILRFVRSPGHFLATTLIGNNLANYVTTVAVGLVATVIGQREMPFIEIVATIMVSPVVFIFGELMPKNLYYRAPMMLLCRDSMMFEFFFRLFFPISFPLIWITRLFERKSGSDHQAMELVLGRKRLVQVLSEGHQRGLLTEVQRHLSHGILHAATESVIQSVTPLDRVLGVSDDLSNETASEFANRYGLTIVPVKNAGTPDESWYGYVRAIDVAMSRQPLRWLVRSMPRLDAESSKLTALTQLRDCGAAYGAVFDGDRQVGIISEHGLTEQMIRPSRSFDWSGPVLSQSPRAT